MHLQLSLILLFLASKLIFFWDILIFLRSACRMECVKSTSLVIMPPPQFWPDFVDIKKNHMNPKIKRPPYPHITLFVGFLSQHLPISLSPFAHTRHFEEARSKLQILLKNVKPFRINIRTFKLFENGPSCTLYLEPEISVHLASALH